MAKEPASILSATALAERLHLTPPTVSKVLKMLADAILVDSVRGAEGGYHLAKPAANISVVDVIAAMEGDIAMTECCDDTSLCAIASMCRMKENWRYINGMVKGLLQNFSILDMVSPLRTESVSNE